MAYKVNVSEEYLDTVASWLETWGEKPSSLVISQFLSEYGIGWSYFKQFRDLSPKINNIFETVIAKLHARWVDYAFQKKDLPRHLTSLLMRYIRVYDDHAYQLETDAKKEIAESSAGINFTRYKSENYSDADLQGIYKKFYELNEKKRKRRK